MCRFIPNIVGLCALLFLVPQVIGQSVRDYAPATGVQCPDEDIIRVFSAETQSLHPSEAAYVSARASEKLVGSWNEYLGDGSDIGYEVSDFENDFPKIGIAISGGGHRAAQYGAGVLSALDARNQSSKAAGTGGLLQVVSYMSALSGGSWLASSLYINDFPTISDLVFGNGKNIPGWLLDFHLLIPDGLNIFSEKNQAYFGSLILSVLAKDKTGIDTSLTDPWSRALSFHFLNQTTRENLFTNDSAHGAGLLWSKIPETQPYKDHAVPFPIILAAARPSGFKEDIIPIDATVYEMTPYEFTSFDPDLSAGANMKFVGTNLDNGSPANRTSCVTELDEVGFVMGTSSSLFNLFIDRAREDLEGAKDDDFLQPVKFLLGRLLQEFRSRANDVANWPNPFTGVASSTFKDTRSTWLELIDGGSNGEVVPFGPLLVKSRDIDVIIGVDTDSNDDNDWPNGLSPILSSKRVSQILGKTHQPFPPVPSTTQEFTDAGLNQRPTFFGCDPAKFPAEYPLVIYLPNSPPLTGEDPVTNPPTLKFQYSLEHTQKFLDQVHANTIGGFTPNSNVPDPNWGKCLKCAAIDRARGVDIARSEVCAKCFKQYCYDPKSPPSKAELPNRKLTFVNPTPDEPFLQSFFKKNKALVIGVSVGVGLFIILLVVGCCVWCSRRRKTKKTEYHKLQALHD